MNHQKLSRHPSERVAIGEARAARDKKDAAQRMIEGGKRGGRGKKKLSVNFTESLETGQSRDVTAHHVRLDYKTYAKAKERQREAGKKHGRGKIASEKFTEAIEAPLPVRDTTAAAVGWSGPTYAKAQKVVAAAREDEEFQPLVEQMDQTGNVTRAYNQLPAYLRETPPEDDAPPGDLPCAHGTLRPLLLSVGAGRSACQSRRRALQRPG